MTANTGNRSLPQIRKGQVHLCIHECPCALYKKNFKEVIFRRIQDNYRALHYQMTQSRFGDNLQANQPWYQHQLCTYRSFADYWTSIVSNWRPGTDSHGCCNDELITPVAHQSHLITVQIIENKTCHAVFTIITQTGYHTVLIFRFFVLPNFRFGAKNKIPYYKSDNAS